MMSIRSSAAVLKTIWGACSKRNATIRTFGRQAGANIAKLLWHKVGYMNQTLAMAEQKFAALDLSSADLHQIGGIGNQWFRRQRPKSMTYSSGFPNGSGRGSMEKMR
jgi:hypothetical protein